MKECGSRQSAAEAFHVGLPTSAVLSTGGRDQPGPAIHLTSAETCIFPEITGSGKNVFGGCSETLMALEQF